MNAMTSTEFRKSLSTVLDKVVDDCEPVIVVRNGKKPTVTISLAEYNSLIETSYLMSNPANAKRLMESIENLNKGEFVTKTMDELIAMED